ncbi:hypothetical protein IB286_05345 [Spongiibacter sp. KMU-158]|uniref:Uncharacterized protein n=1 Tax=Spongiibacter pelagi TaxID=2760804 RepID=A0A927C0F5_9GAMM|nr:hypothetical protein [Spongiibacter pelagi]MBD2858429.1 hypothetical protein [Spongiibacter pelagi]
MMSATPNQNSNAPLSSELLCNFLLQQELSYSEAVLTEALKSLSRSAPVSQKLSDKAVVFGGRS